MTARVLLSCSIVAALALAGCVASPEDAQSASTSNGVAEATPAYSEAISLDGAIGLGAYACPAVVCAGRTLVEGERIFETGATGVVDVALTMEWSATSPNSAQMLVGVFTCDPEACQSDADLTQIEYAFGASPLAFEIEGIEVPEGEGLYVFTNVGPLVSGLPVWAMAMTPQDFHIEGEISSGWSS